MGRNILRRPIIVLLLSVVCSISPGFSDSLPLPPKKGISFPQLAQTGIHLPPKQNQSVKKAWSVNIELIAESRPEISFWIDKWESPEGRKKIEASMARFFEFRKPVDRIIRQSGLPWELVSIPVVESNWRIDAVSSSGAAGPWQFLESSARGRGLIIDAWRDERRDVWRSTDAAMKELAFYHRLFSDWLLAAASYNAGPTRLRQLRDESGLNSFWELLDAGLLPGETENYVPQLIAVTYIMAHGGRLGLPINWKNPTSWRRIDTDRSIPVQAMIKANGMDAKLVKSAYLDLHHPVTPPPSQPYALKVPEQDAAKVLLWLDSLERSNAPERFWRYTVQSGDTLSGIAARLDISISELLSYNSHVRSGTLRIGERLYLPGNEIKPEGAEEDNLPEWTGRYRVASGDSFWSIARIYGIRPELLAEANHRSLTSVLLAGSMLHVPGGITGGEKEEL